MAIQLPDAVLEHLEQVAAQHFAEEPLSQSLMLLVAQYWADGALDEIHARSLVSRRRTPLWPHACLESGFEEELEEQNDDWLDRCNHCGPLGRNLRYPLEPPPECAAYIREYGSEEGSVAQTYVPFAVARRSPHGVEIETVAQLQRPRSDAVDATEQPLRWLDDPGARALFDELCRCPDEEAPYRMLADYLSERGHLHGELLRLELEPSLEPALDQHRARLRHEVGRAWLAPLQDVLHLDGAHFHRGFLRSAVVVQDSVQRGRGVNGSPVWATLQSLEIIGPASFLDPAMTSLRSVDTVDSLGLATIAGAARPWAIQDLTVSLDSDRAVEDLLSTRNLPALRRLRVRQGKRRAALTAGMCDAPWWPSLDRLCLDGISLEEGLEWSAACGRPVSVGHGDWEVRLAPERWQARLVSWRGGDDSTLHALVSFLADWDVTVALEETAQYVPEPIDLEMIRRISPAARARFELAR